MKFKLIRPDSVALTTLMSLEGKTEIILRLKLPLGLHFLFITISEYVIHFYSNLDPKLKWSDYTFG